MGKSDIKTIIAFFICYALIIALFKLWKDYEGKTLTPVVS